MNIYSVFDKIYFLFCKKLLIFLKYNSYNNKYCNISVTKYRFFIIILAQVMVHSHELIHIGLQVQFRAGGNFWTCQLTTRQDLDSGLIPSQTKNNFNFRGRHDRPP